MEVSLYTWGLVLQVEFLQLVVFLLVKLVF
jgi:hypothetical protein